MKLLDTIKDIICESSKFNGTVTHDHRNRRTDMAGEAMRWKDKSPTYRQAATMEDEDLELEETTLSTISRKGRANLSPEAIQDLEAFHPDFLPEEMSIEDLENGSFNKGKYYTIQSPQKWVQKELGEDLKYWSYDIKKNNLGQHLDEYVDKDLYKTLKLNKGGEFNEEEDLDEYRFDFYEEDTRDCPKGMYYCSDDKICKPDSQRLKEQVQGTDVDEYESSLNKKGGYNNPIDIGTDKDVPGNSFNSRTYDSKTGKYYRVAVPTTNFFKIVKLLVNSHPFNWFTSNGPNLDDSLYSRQEEVYKSARMLGIDSRLTNLLDKLFWAAYDNYNEIKDGTVTNYDELELRPFLRVSVPMVTNASVYKEINYIPTVDSYDVNDAVMEVDYDEDNVYEAWEWEGTDGYEEVDVDYESGDNTRGAGSPSLKVLYPAESGNRTSSGLTFGDGSDD
tara:strand:+ start:4076 stop:5416 length:1341 start_codon:yes stop_codon:yes gene_type:complete